MRIPLALTLALASRAVAAQCVVGSFEVADHSRTRGIPFESPADAGAQPARVRGLWWGASSASPGATRPTNGELLTLATPGVDAAPYLMSRLRFQGALVDTAAVERGVTQRSACVRADAPLSPQGARGVVIIMGAFPPVLYEGLASALAADGIVTAALVGDESALRLVINHFASQRFPMERLVLVGHGAGGPAVQLTAMGLANVRGIVSLDGFEALDVRRHPGLTGDPAWRPGNLRAPILHLRAETHPDADSAFHLAASRSAIFHISLNGVAGRQFTTLPQLVLPSESLRDVIGPSAAALFPTVLAQVVDFVRTSMLESAPDLASFPARAGTIGAQASTVAIREPLPRPAVAIDGTLDEPVWATAATLPDATDVSVRVADDCDYAYVAVTPRRPAPFTTELIVETRDRGPLLLHASASLCWTYDSTEVVSAQCNKSEGWWRASRTSQAGDPPVAEYVIAKRALGVARCGSLRGLRVAAFSNWDRAMTYPVAASKARIDSWGRVP